MEQCDDCGNWYPGPAWFTFPEDACTTGTDYNGNEIYHMDSLEGCTGNLCPDCIDHPDDPEDPRWVIDTIDAAANAVAMLNL